MTGSDEYGAGAGEAEGSEGTAGRSGSGVPDWASAETQAASTPPPWAVAQTQTGIPVPPPPPAPAPASPSTPVPPAPPTASASSASPAAPAATDAPAWPTPPSPPPTPSPAYVLTPAPSPAGPGHRRGAVRIAALVALAVVVGAGTGAGVWYAVRGRSGDAASDPATSVGVTAPASPASPAATATVTAPPALPSDPATSEYASESAAPGYRVTEDPVGYTLDVPQGWTRRQQQGEKAPVVYYDSPSDGRQLQIFTLAEATPAESLDLAENAPGYGFARQPGYQLLDRTSGDTWSEVSYRYDDEDKGARQVVDHRFRAADGTLYAIRASGPEDLDPAQVSGPLTTALTSFCPSGGSGCG
jgi:uncharacterized protein (DUF736 family)